MPNRTTVAARPATSKIDTKWFKGLLADKGIKQRAIAATLAMDPAAVSLMLRGRRRLQLGEAAALAHLLGVPLDDVLSHAGIDPDAGAKDMVPIMGWIAMDGEIHMRRPDGPKRTQAPMGMEADAVALRYQGDDAMDGWVAFYVPREGVDADAVGRLCVVHLAGKGPRLIRVVKRGYQRGTWTLTGIRVSEKAIESVELASAAPVLWIKAV